MYCSIYYLTKRILFDKCAEILETALNSCTFARGLKFQVQ